VSNDEEFEPPFLWTLDLPGLTERKARKVIDVLREHAPAILADVEDADTVLVDPSAWFSIIIDRDTAMAVRDALRVAGSGRISSEIVENIEEWLAHTEASDLKEA
jgi:hypothetical protein